MSLLNAARITRAPMASLTAIGVIWGGFAALVPDIKASVAASDANFGLALVMSSVGAMLSLYLSPRVTPLLGRHALPVMGLALAAATLYPTLAGSVPGLALAFLGMGASVSMLDILANVRISALESRHGLHLMNVNHAMFSAAFALAAAGAGIARSAGLSPAQILPMLGLVCLGLAFLMLDRRAPEAPAEDPSTGAPPWGAILLVGLVLFAAFVGENATEAWSALHIERTLGAAPGEGSFGPFMLGATMFVGRMSGQIVAERFGEVRLILGSSLLGITGALVLATAPSVAVAIVGVGILGLGMAVIVPSANSLLGKRVRETQRTLALSRAWMAGLVGFFIGPAMMGGIAELFGLRWSFAVVAMIVAMIVPAILRLNRS